MNNQKIQIIYRNQSNFIHILRITDSRCYLERMIAPGQEIVFEAFSYSPVEIFSYEYITSMLLEKTLASKLIQFIP